MEDSGLASWPETSPSVANRPVVSVPPTAQLAVSLWNRRHHDQFVLDSGELRLVKGRLQPLDFDLNDPELHDFDFTCRLASSRSPQTGGLRLELVNSGRVLLVDRGQRLFPNQRYHLAVPGQLLIGDTTIEFQYGSGDFIDTRRISELPGTDGRIGLGTFPLQSLGLSPSPMTLAHWFDALTELQRLSTASPEFLAGCTRSVVDPGGLDIAMILRWENDRWRIVASHVPKPELGISYSLELVERARATQRTQYSDPNLFGDDEIPEGTRYAVAAPFFDHDRSIGGVVYAMRVPHRHNSRRGIRLLEAQFVNLIADAVTSGTMRVHQEADNVRQQLLLEHAFSQRVARELKSNPSILQPQNREVTLLFADLRDSTRLAQRLTPAELYELLGELMDHWTQAVSELDGVILDYFGDGLAAFWNAPLEQCDHAQLACLAAMASLERLPEFNRRWEEKVGQALEFGLGVHTGSALVGNSGTSRRIKYGPRGETVHIANRIESAAKAIGLPLVISQATQQRLSDSFLIRRLARVRLPGVDQPQPIYQPLAVGAAASLRETARHYETALADFEHGNLASALGRLGDLMNAQPQDIAVRWLLGWVQKSMRGANSRRSGDADATFVPLQNNVE